MRILCIICLKGGRVGLLAFFGFEGLDNDEI